MKSNDVWANNAWSDKQVMQLHQVESYREIAPIALAVQQAMKGHLVQVCGPISTGGSGKREINIEIFKKTIAQLKNLGYTVYDQTPFEIAIARLRKKGLSHGDLLEDVYRPLFASGNIAECFFIFDWESSKGSCWEHAVAKKAGIKISYLPKDFV